MATTKDAVVLRGERVTLRPMTYADARDLMRWGNDADFAWFQWGRSPGRWPDDASAREWIDRFAQRSGVLFAIEHDGRAVGFANYRDWQPKAKSAEIGIGIGEKALWSKGLGREALGLLVKHLVDDVGAHRVNLHVLAYNDRAINSYKAAGFEVEGIERDAVMTDRGSYSDDVAMAYIAGRKPPAFDPRPVTLEGAHVRLEPLRMEHAAELFAAVDAEVFRFLSMAPFADVDEAARYIRSALDLQIRGEHLPWLTRRLADGRAVGTTRYGAIDRQNRSLEIGWTMVGPEARRTVTNTEAKYLQLKHAFETLGAVRVWLKTDVINERSQRAIQRIGATLEGVIRNERFLPNGRLRDAKYYSITDRDWVAVKEPLLRRTAR
ncbi:MAG TPA: GNAT family protein [Candidatus Limnocylindria bacterium]